MINKLFLGVLLICLCGCPGNQSTAERKTDPSTGQVATNVPVPEKTMSPSEQNIAVLQKKLDEAEKKASEASAKGDIIVRLSSEKDSLGIRVQLAEAYAKQWKQNAETYSAQEASKEQELKEAKLDAWKTKLWWMAGICGLLAIVAFGISWGMPLLSPIASKAAIILGVIAGIMLFVAQSLSTIAWLLDLVPYVLALGGVAAIVYVVVALRHWFKDHHGLAQTIKGIEPIKDKIENFGTHMNQYVDSAMVDQVSSYREKIKALEEKAKKLVSGK